MISLGRSPVPLLSLGLLFFDQEKSLEYYDRINILFITFRLLPIAFSAVESLSAPETRSLRGVDNGEEDGGEETPLEY
jgi:hypothetical protein